MLFSFPLFLFPMRLLSRATQVHKQFADMPHIFVAWTAQLHNGVLLASLISKLMDGF